MGVRIDCGLVVTAPVIAIARVNRHDDIRARIGKAGTGQDCFFDTIYHFECSPSQSIDACTLAHIDEGYSTSRFADFTRCEGWRRKRLPSTRLAVLMIDWSLKVNVVEPCVLVNGCR